MSFYKRLGSKLKRERIKRGLSQMVVAKALKVSFQMIQKYEAGICRIPVDKLATLCKLWGLSVDELIVGVRG